MRGLVGERVQFGLPQAGVEPGQVDHGQGGSAHAAVALHEAAASRAERGAQDAMAVGECGERSAQRRDVERSGEAEPERDVVGGGARRQHVEEHELFLQERGGRGRIGRGQRRGPGRFRAVGQVRPLAHALHGVCPLPGGHVHQL